MWCQCKEAWSLGICVLWQKYMYKVQDRCVFLAHLSRRLMGEPIVYQSLRRPSVLRPQSQTSSPLKSLGQLTSNFIWRLLRTRERNFVQIADVGPTKFVQMMILG